MTEQQQPRVVLAKRPPWNPTEYAPWGNRYIVLGGRQFVAESQGPGLWTVWEVDGKGEVANPNQDWVAFAFRLDQIREAVRLRVAGKTEDEIAAGLRDMPRPGTGRNHPKNVALRESWRNR